MTIIETERMLLRFVEPGDLDALAAIYSDPETGRFIGGPADRNETWDRIQRMRRFYRERRCGPYVALLKSTGEMIGRCGFLFWTIEGRDEVEIAYSLARRFWGQGLATKRFVRSRATVSIGCTLPE
jgi:RimJ/RimL family protein N-acetyltransferase